MIYKIEIKFYLIFENLNLKKFIKIMKIKRFNNLILKLRVIIIKNKN